MCMRERIFGINRSLPTYVLELSRDSVQTAISWRLKHLLIWLSLEESSDISFSGSLKLRSGYEWGSHYEYEMGKKS